MSVRYWRLQITRWIGYVSPEQAPFVAQALEELAQEFRKMRVIK